MSGAAFADVAALFVRADSIYKRMRGVDCWDAERDAMQYAGPHPVVAHPPCKRWSMINGVVLSRYPHNAAEFAWGNDGGVFAAALQAVRRFGGVLEHPAHSRAFGHYGLPRIGRGPDEHGGWAFEVRQRDWGHRAEKRTWLYVCGIEPDDVPELPPPGEATALVVSMPECRAVELMGKAEREHTPPAFARWLIELARRTSVRSLAPVGADASPTHENMAPRDDLQPVEWVHQRQRPKTQPAAGKWPCLAIVVLAAGWRHLTARGPYERGCSGAAVHGRPVPAARSVRALHGAADAWAGAERAAVRGWARRAGAGDARGGSGGGGDGCA